MARCAMTPFAKPIRLKGVYCVAYTDWYTYYLATTDRPFVPHGSHTAVCQVCEVQSPTEECCVVSLQGGCETFICPDCLFGDD
jgi:hypothetical protein